MAQQLFTAIAFFPPGDGRKGWKYRNISNLPHFDRFAAKAGFWYANIYCKESKQYIERRYYQKQG